MAHSLNISQAAYSKIENMQTKLTVERLYLISDILDVCISKLLDLKLVNQLNQTNQDNSVGYLQQIDKYYNDNKELYDKILSHYENNIQSKDAIILELKNQINIMKK